MITTDSVTLKHLKYFLAATLMIATLTHCTDEEAIEPAAQVVEAVYRSYFVK